MQMKKLELKTVWELSPEELQELDLQEGEELSLFEGDPDRMDIPGMDENYLTESNRIYFFIWSEKNMVITSYETEYSNELLEFCKGQDTKVSRSGYNSRSETWHWEYLEKNTWEWWEECKKLKIAYRWGCGYVYTLFEYVENHELFEYLDGFEFVWEFEVINAIEDFFKNWEWTSWGELSEYQELAREWMESRNVKFD